MKGPKPGRHLGAQIRSTLALGRAMAERLKLEEDKRCN